MSGSLYVVAGEMSGDAHAAGLLKALMVRRPELRVRGAGGRKMREVAGEGITDWLDQAAVMGIVEVLKHYRWFKERFEAMLAEVREMKPEVLLLVDYPGFNLRFAKAVREALPETKIVQYVCPQVWAWKKGRVKTMDRVLDEVLCLLPFEPEIFQKRRLKATFVGHPMVDELDEARIEGGREADLIGLLPGSRENEVSKLFPIMLATAERLAEERPQLRFAVPAANARVKALLEEMAASSGLGKSLLIEEGGAHALMQRCACGMVASGTATVEAAFFGMPHCLVYRLAWLTFILAKLIVRVKYAGLINILAKEEIVEEFLQCDAEPCQLEPAISRFLDEPSHAAQLSERLIVTTQCLGTGGVSERAAEAVDRWLA